MDHEPVDCVFVDFGGVLATHGLQRGRRKWEAVCSLVQDDLARRVFSSDISQRAFRGLADEQDVWAEFGERFGLTEEQQKEFAIDFWSDHSLDEEMWGLCKMIRRQCPVVLTSNLWKGSWESLVQPLGVLRENFDSVFLSYEMQLAKPDAQFFEFVLRAMTVKPSRVLFIDDELPNVCAARAIGIRAHLHNGYDETYEWMMARLGVPKRADRS